MKKQQGISLMEVLLSISLLSGISLSLVHQQSQIRYLITQKFLAVQKWNEEANAKESKFVALRKREFGMSLTEVMVALCLASLIMTALLSHYCFAKRQYQESSEKLKQALELQFVSGVMRNSIRSAGFTPCLGFEHLLLSDQREDPHTIQAISANVGGKRAGFQLARMGENFVPQFQDLFAGEKILKLSPFFTSAEEIMIADCFHAEIHKVSHLQKTQDGTGTIITLIKPLKFTYSAPVYIGEWLEEQFFIDKNKEGKDALFYDRSRRDVLTKEVVNLAIEIQKPLINLKLKLEDGREWIFATRIRTP